MIELKELTDTSSTKKPLSTCEVVIYCFRATEQGEVCLKSLVQYEEPTQLPKTPPKLTPKPLPVLTTGQPVLSNCKGAPKLRLKQTPEPLPKVSHLWPLLPASIS